jgi:hypothetical protein
MTSIATENSKRYRSLKLAAGLAISAFVVFGTFAGSASAQQRREENRHWDRGGDHGDRGNWGGGGYYAPPPVVYGAPYYAPPPVVYAPGVGVNLPGVSIGIQ